MAKKQRLESAVNCCRYCRQMITPSMTAVRLPDGLVICEQCIWTHTRELKDYWTGPRD